MEHLHGRYKIQEVLGRGGFATTYLALDEQTGRRCAIKCLSFSKIDEWKTLELFKREARVLKNLVHDRIPEYVDFFTIETDQDVQLYLVQEYVEGKSLAHCIREGQRFTETEVIGIALECARILEYLQRFSPPIIHRDIKPGNIILNQNAQPFLIDFGSVKEKLQDDLTSSGDAPTVVGTYGYMPLEQVEGRAVPASDIYALGMTLIYLLSHTEPAQMEKRGLQLDFRPHVNISRQFAAILDRMIAPDWHDRYQSASDVRQALEGLRSGKIHPKPVSPPSKRARMLAAGIGAALVVLIVASGILYWQLGNDTAQPPPPPPPQPATFDEPLNAPPRKFVPEEPPLNQAPNAAHRAETSAGKAPEGGEPPGLQASSTSTSLAMVSADSIPVVTPVDGKLSINIYRDFVYVPTGWPLGLTTVGQSNAVGLDREPYEQLVRESEYRSGQVFYGYLPLGNGNDRRISFVFDDVEQDNWVVYVDANNNEDLTDDGPPHPNEGTSTIAARLNLSIEILMSSGELTEQPYRVWLWYIEEQGTPRFYTQCHYAGRLLLDGDSYAAVAYEMYDHDGLFKESGLWIDLNHDEALDEGAEHFQDGSVVTVNDHTYQLGLLYP